MRRGMTLSALQLKSAVWFRSKVVSCGTLLCDGCRHIHHRECSRGTVVADDVELSLHLTR
jgi:hypothetical protein